MAQAGGAGAEGRPQLGDGDPGGSCSPCRGNSPLLGSPSVPRGFGEVAILDSLGVVVHDPRQSRGISIPGVKEGGRSSSRDDATRSRLGSRAQNRTKEMCPSLTKAKKKTEKKTHDVGVG
jgi:hypothetical protein